MSSQPGTSQYGADRPHPFRYTAQIADEIERRWQATWEERSAFRQPNPGEAGFDASRPKYYCLDMFPYPSGAGLHVGHPEGYTATDIMSRYRRMTGHNVLHPMGWDAFGLPAEQYAIQTGIHPAITTRQAIDNFRRQLKRFGFSYDWSREFGTIDEGYYRWTQWIFLKLFDSWFDPAQGRARPIGELVAALERGRVGVNTFGEVVPLPTGSQAITGSVVGVRMWHELSDDERGALIDTYRLAYRSETTVNWCPKLGTVLANDEVIEGRSERGGHPVVRKPLSQWAFRITSYAERLLKQLDALEWPASTKTMQREWIGRSEGAEIDFAIDGTDQNLRVFTTRPDTLFGATYMVIAPEHPLVQMVIDGPGPHAAAVADYAARTRRRSDVERQESREKTGVFTGLRAINPATGQAVPVWTAEYVLMGYGTGAIMAVPAHDERDFEFAQAHGLPMRDVVYQPPVFAMRHFALHAYPDGPVEDGWRERLADFIGISITGAPSKPAAERLRRVFQQRAAAPDQVCEVGPMGSRRGVTQRVWLEVIEDLHVSDFGTLRREFEAGMYHASHDGALAEAGIAANSTNADISLDGMHSAEAKEAVLAWLEAKGFGARKVNYRLRDWVFSRQRYWGEPFPIVYDAGGRAYPVGESHLPVKLPALADYAPVESQDPMPLLAKAHDWMKTTAGDAGVAPSLLAPETPVWRETNTMPGSAGSSWYAIRYCDALNPGRFVGREAEAYWMAGGVDLYVGGSEHAVGHLLYSRFWQNVLFDLGEVTTPEPFRRLFHQGLITSFAYQRKDKTLVPVDQVSEPSEGAFVETATGAPVSQIVAKMSKSLKNVVNPDDVIAEFGADTFRLYEMYMGPLEASKPWNPRDIAGLFRFLQRLWRLAVDEETGKPRASEEPSAPIEKLLHRLVVKVGADIDRLSLNTAIAAAIEFVNACVGVDKGQGALTSDQVRRLALTLCPFVPHIAEELWARHGGAGFASHQAWPQVDARLLVDDELEVPVQVAGKVRSRVMVPAGADAGTHERVALADARVQEFIAGKPVRKVIVVPGKMVNVVV